MDDGFSQMCQKLGYYYNSPRLEVPSARAEKDVICLIHTLD